jgi:hypothetical protein
MSALGQMQTCATQKVMSALPPKSGPLPAWPLELKATSGTVTVRIAEDGFATSRSVIKSAKGSVRAWTHNASW